VKRIGLDEFNELLNGSTLVGSKLRRELKFTTSVAEMTDEEWELSEMIPIFDKSRHHGVLLVDFGESERYIIPFDFSTSLSSSDGRVKPIICDLCRTWRPGSQAGSITFPKDKRSLRSVRFLCCNDLKCSLNVRDKTAAALRSRTQIWEDVTIEGKVKRLRSKLAEIINDIGAEKLQ
jgi:hypothetical protein